MVGLMSAETVRGLFGEAGAWIGLAATAAVSLTLGLGVDWQRTFGTAATGVGVGVPKVAGAGRELGRAAVSGAAGFREAVLLRLAGPDEPGTEGEWTDATGADVDEVTGWEDATGTVAVPSVAAPVAAETPPAAPPGPPMSVRLPSRSSRLAALPETMEPELGPLPRPTLRPMDLVGRKTATVGPTRVAERELVEVEWDPTSARIDGGVSEMRGTVADPKQSFVAPDPFPASPIGPDIAEVGFEDDDDWNQPVLETPSLPRPSFPDVFHDARSLSDDDDLDAEPPTRPSLAPPPLPAKPLARPAPARTPAGMPLQVAPGALESGGDDHGGVLIDSVEDVAFELPHLGLLDRHEKSVAQFDEIELRAMADKLSAKLEDFGIKGEVTAIRPGPVITTYEYLPHAGIKLSKITALEDDIAMALCALRVRIVAPIPGKGVVGFEVPNTNRADVWIRDILASDVFREKERALPIALGKNVEGKPLVGDLAKAPHLLVAGTTGSGKSVGVNAMLLAMLYTRTPEELRLILIDPKMLEFELYQDIPHLLHPVVTDPALASAALKWACDEMDRRYALLARWKTRNIASYNDLVRKALADWSPKTARKYAPRDWPANEPPPPPRPLPYIVVVIDELADLMMVAAKDVEVSIARLAQKARAAGIHLIVATQRPEKTVVTGIIKANLPSRIAFQVRSKLDGRIILDTSGAETLLGKGDMLYLPPGSSELVRCQSAFVDDDEVRRVTDHLRSQGAPVYEADIRLDESGGDGDEEIEYDELYDMAVAYVVEQGKASTSMVQRQFKIGYNRAARIVEVMEMEGLVAPADGARPRKVLVGGHAG